MIEKFKPLLKTLDENYAKLPALPKGATDFLVGIAPWAALIVGVLGLILGVLGLLAAVSASAVVATLPVAVGAYGAGYGAKYMFMAVVGAVVLIVMCVLYLLAYPSLKARKVKGWNLMFYVLLLSVLSSVVSLNVFGIVESLIGALIGYYFLYQVKSYYK